MGGYIIIDKDIKVAFGGQLTFDEFKRFNFYFYRKKFLMFIVIAILISLFFIQDISNWLPLAILTICIIIFTVGLFSYFLIYLRVRKSFFSDRLLGNVIKYTADVEGIKSQIKKSNSIYEWEDIVSIYEYKDMFLLFISTSKAIVLPKRYFHSQNDIKVFKALISKFSTSKKVKLM